MKKLIFLVFGMVFLFTSCDDDSSSNNTNNNNTNNVSDPCSPNPCSESNKTVCTTQDGTAICGCDDGYIENNGVCISESNNPCSTENNPCLDDNHELQHRTVCNINTSNQAECLCNEGFEEDTNGICSPIIVDECPDGLQCLGSVCIPFDTSNEQCIGDLDCQENLSEEEGNYTICNFKVVGGMCAGCRTNEPDDCPTGYFCNDFGSCSKICNDDTDCPFGHCNQTYGFCTIDTCTKDSDCAEGTVCIDDNGDGSGNCTRISCIETECSPYNPNGSCASGESCIGGSCVSSCTPNPCTEDYKTVCSESNGAPECLCDSGYEEDSDGNCVPAATSDCETGFTCTNGYCIENSAPFQCVVDSDCGGSMTCSPTLPTGTCSGCTTGTDCPSGFAQCIAGYCFKSCSTNNDCPAAMECNTSLSVCGKKSCTETADCPTGYVCAPHDDGNKCERSPCTQ